jgi:pilus assembly protein CpaD
MIGAKDTTMMVNVTCRASSRRVLARIALVACAAVATASCRPENDDAQMRAGALMLSDPTARHPISVSEEPTSMSVKIGRYQDGLSAHQSTKIAEFFSSYRRRGMSSSRLVIEAPSGSANDTATMRAVSEMRYLADTAGIDPSSVRFEAYNAARGADASLKLSFMKAVAYGPDCGYWPTNLATNRENENYDNFACAQQKNLAAMVANPSDLTHPRGMGPSSSERRDVIYGKYVKGDATTATKSADERASTDK